MKYRATAIANSFVEIAAQEYQELTPMQLPKLVYFAHGWHFAYQCNALSIDYAEAWPNGPVFSDLHHALKDLGPQAVREPVGSMLMAGGGRGLIPDGDEFAMAVIRKVWQVYGVMPEAALAQLACESGGPWDVTRRQPDRMKLIPNSLIQRHFCAKRKENADAGRSARSSG